MTKDELNQELRRIARNGRPSEADELTERLFPLICAPAKAAPKAPEETPAAPAPAKPAAKAAAKPAAKRAAKK